MYLTCRKSIFAFTAILGRRSSAVRTSILVTHRSIGTLRKPKMTVAEGSQKSATRKPESMEPILRLNNIEKSLQDTRDYRGLQLENGLKVLLISDPKTDVSAAALSVQVGHMSDPTNLPGLAHFCEHMLFLGTEKYPHENGYTTYLSQSGGSSNAATYPLMTKYHFHVAPDKLDGALDRFAQFFIAPLFTPSATEREINAVNSEHEKNLPSDLWRIKQVNRHLAKPDHAYSKFGSGNKTTLSEIPKSKNIDVRDELLKFHKKWYSANIMCLAVIGKESLDELEGMVLEKFSEIENKNVAVPDWPRHPYAEERYGQKVKIVPIKDIRSLTISFTTDDLTEFYKSGPDNYLTHLIGHEGKGSILSELRRLGWCNDLMAGHQNTQNGFGFFDIVVDLTQEGLEHVDDIVKIVFQYLGMLREEGPKKWIFDECVKLNEMRFRFKEKEQPETLVTHAVSSMQIFPLEEVLIAPYLSNEWRPDLIKSLLDELVPSKSRIVMVSQSFEQDCDLAEPYYKTKYGVERVTKDTVQCWENCDLNENLKLALPNSFIPTNFDISDVPADAPKHPTIIMDTPILRVWHKQDNQFNKPKACMTFDMSNPIAYLDPLNCNLNHMMVMLLKDQLNEYLYDAELASLKLSVMGKTCGIDFTIRGFSDKQVVLLEKLLDHLFDFSIDEKRFDILKEEYVRSLKNFKAEQPYQHSIYYLALLLTENAWANVELLDAMELVTYDRVLNFAKEFFQRLHTECFIFGNVTKQQATDIAGRVNTRLEATNASKLPILARQMLKKREYKLLAGDSYLFEKENEFHKSSCTQLYLQCGAQTDRTNIMVNLVSQVLSEPCYDCLRTKEQLGYIVFSGVRKVNGANGIRIIVQSAKHPSFVEDRIENFLQTYLQVIEDMPLDEFERHKEALAVKKLEKPKTIFQQFSQFYGEIAMQTYHFEREEAEVAILRKISKADFVDYFKKFIAKDGDERRVLSVHIVSQQTDENASTETEPVEITNMERHKPISDIVTFKSCKELYPIAMPFLDIKAKGGRSKL
ncbi:insulin-degrading enzyme isoform X1 [Drosophila subpulchrella]|uniref:insulin-degrading enzyme isoform X1 n=2 Tax=Drosophila subpulchrella TaxID=1486046 RepID=UPI0018A139E0|nr:insulin-degrading enzyme isoform X1 [Drosophila subpulchrella]